MYHIKNDLRAKRSAEIIYQALVTLMDEKPFETIKVNDIVARAEIGRSTFYRNFDLIEDVLRMRCDQVFDELVSYMVAYRQENNQLENTLMLKPLLRYFYLNSDIVTHLLRAQRLDILQETFQERAFRFQELIAKQLQVSETHLAYIIKIRISIMCTILAHWVETGKREAPDELADTLKGLMDRRGTIVDWM